MTLKATAPLKVWNNPAGTQPMVSVKIFKPPENYFPGQAMKKLREFEEEEEWEEEEEEEW